jgi:hypothetical protein
VNIGQAEISPAVAVNEFGVIESEQMEHRRVEVVQMDNAVDRLVAKLVGGTVSQSASRSATGQPSCVAFGVVVSPFGFFTVENLGLRRSAEFSRPQHKRVFEQSALSEVG